MKFGKAKVKMSREELELLIDQAYYKAPSSDFVASCETFLEENGYLSEKQIQALINVKPAAFLERSSRHREELTHAEDMFDSYGDEDSCYD